MSPHDNDHDHGHSHDHDHEPHPYQPDIEDAPYTERMVMAQAVEELLIEKGLFTAEQMRAQIESIDGRSPSMGAQVVARAWTDSEFKARLLEDANAASAELGTPVDALR